MVGSNRCAAKYGEWTLQTIANSARASRHFSHCRLMSGTTHPTPRREPSANGVSSGSQSTPNRPAAVPGLCELRNQAIIAARPCRNCHLTLDAILTAACLQSLLGLRVNGCTAGRSAPSGWTRWLPSPSRPIAADWARCAVGRARRRAPSTSRRRVSRLRRGGTWRAAPASSRPGSPTCWTSAGRRRCGRCRGRDLAGTLQTACGTSRTSADSRDGRLALPALIR